MNGRTLIIGAGPAGLTAAWELTRLGRTGTVVEKDAAVGGISRTVHHNGYRFDLGGHRFFTKEPEIRRLWNEWLGDDLLSRSRRSRIYYRGKFFTYPLRPLEALAALGPTEAIRIVLSYGRARLSPVRDERNLEQWVVNRFGRRLYEIFFRSYTEKVWGVPCTEISAEWAAQRIKNLDLGAAIRNALVGRAAGRSEVVISLIDRFAYPRLGPGMMWERCRDLVQERGVEVLTGTAVVGLRHRQGRIMSAVVEAGDGRREVPASDVISSMPIADLVHALDPPPPADISRAAGRLRYRDFLTVLLIVDRAEVFPDNWIYVHEPEVQVGRIQNFKNWSPEMVPDPSRTALGLEYFLQDSDELWSRPDAELAELATRELARLGLVDPAEVVDHAVVRVPRSYPAYDPGSLAAVREIRGYLSAFGNLQLIGRNGQHRYNNQDHSMVTGILAARNVAGGDHDVWSVNLERSYHEEVAPLEAPGRALAEGGGSELDELLREAFAQYDPVALGGAVAIVAASGLFLATAVLLLRDGQPVGPTLSLLANYLFGFEVSWPGALLGGAEAAAGGFVFGYTLARLINLVVDTVLRSTIRECRLARALDPLDPGGDSSPGF